MLIGPGIARAGVIIQERIGLEQSGSPPSVSSRALMIQGEKEKVQVNDHLWMILDATDQTATVVNSGLRAFRQFPLRAIAGSTLDPDRLLYTVFKITSKTHTLLGSKCRDYTANSHGVTMVTATTACFSTGVTGSTDFNRFIRTVLQQRSYGSGAPSIPEGLPLTIESIRTVNPSIVPTDIPKEEAVRFEKRIASIPPEITRVEVTKISAANLAADEFTIPAGYSRIGRARR